MAVRFKLSDTFLVRDVVIPVLTESGDTEDMTLHALFKRGTYDECQALRQQQDLVVAKDRLVGWEAQDEETGQPVPFNEETKAALLSLPSAPYALALAFFRASQGSPAKN